MRAPRRREFSPKALKAVRQSLVESGLCRRTVNQRIGQIVRVFRFAVENELVPAGSFTPSRPSPDSRPDGRRRRRAYPSSPWPMRDVDALRPHVSR